MTAIRVIFDGKAFIPQQPVSLPYRSEAMVIVNEVDPAAQAERRDAIARLRGSAKGERLLRHLLTDRAEERARG